MCVNGTFNWLRSLSVIASHKPLNYSTCNIHQLEKRVTRIQTRQFRHRGRESNGINSVIMILFIASILTYVCSQV